MDTNTPKVSGRIQRLEPSATLAMSAKVRELKAQGVDVISLSLGETDFFTPDAVKEAAKKAIDDNYSFYSPVAGYPELKKAVCLKFKRDNNLDYQPNQIVVSTGAKNSIYNVMQVLVDKGDEVLVPAPYWVSYVEIIKLAEGTPVIMPTTIETNFKITPEQLEAAITPKTKAIIYSSPSNPTGAVYPKETLLKLVDIAREFGLIIFADEVYDKILYEDAKHIAIASLSTDVLTITFNSLSKAYRACGYRAGWMIISGNKLPARDFIEGLNMLANMKLCANVPGQWAIQTALGGYQSINDLVCEGGRLRVQRDLAWELLTQIPGVTCVKPQGSLYMFPRLDPKIYPIENDRQFFKELLEATRVLLVQGTGFNWPHPDHFRVVFLPHEPQLREAISRIAEYLAAWRAAHPVKEEPATPRKKEGAAE